MAEREIAAAALAHNANSGSVVVMKPDPPSPVTEGLGGPVLEAHSMDPVVVLDLLAGLGGAVDRVLVVGCAPASLDEGIGLSAPVEGAVDRAVDAIEDLLGDLCAPIARTDAKETCP